MLGDLNNDGTTDFAVGAYGDDDGGTDRGAVWILFMNNNGTVKSHQKISDTQGNFSGTMRDQDQFGWALGSWGDYLVVGARGDDDGGKDQGAIWLLKLNNNGTVQSHKKISAISGGFKGDLDPSDFFGASILSPSDFNGDGVADILVGATHDDDGRQG